MTCSCCTCEPCRRLRIRLILNTYFPERLANDNLPDWDDLCGVAPDATGDLSSEEFIRRQRDEWDEALARDVMERT